MSIYILSGFKPKPKARPQRAGRVMFVPKEYLAWKQAIRDYLAANYNPKPITSRFAFGFTVLSPSKPLADMDNILGALLDAIQPARAKGDVRAQRALEEMTTLEERLAMSPGCLISDDKHLVTILESGWKQSKQRGIVLQLEER